ncbi:hypothetical protein GCM10007416_23250 [Kroppenstedtia guangzhouensis]|uniref:Uncharacterized protein n=1 Tax=Kroppenstedtia guangzhouensis TaxID=1274356 RepID=A0ABQ1GSZ7_9BACL|nr:hypothetical protein [Kroppenstedtia guangzhouensis]GGA49514.1 hypothetical protein GCM10007416_23250 [Kroppenstedtia guangzhouensis]
MWHRLETLRGTNGTNINPYNARLLPEVPRHFLLRRLARHRRNAFLLVDQLRGLCDVSCVGYGGLVFIKSGFPEELKDLITYLALSRKLSITEGTSFGFNMTRVCIADQEDGAYLQIACGTENIHHFSEIANLIRDALKAVESRKIQSSLRYPMFFPGLFFMQKSQFR